MRKTYITLSLGIAVVLVWTGSALFAYQDDLTAPSKQFRATNTFPTELVTASPFDRRHTQNGVFGRAIKKSTPMDSAIEAMKNAEGDSEQREAESKVRELLEEQYRAFLVENEQQIEQLQQRLNNLKDQLDRRRRAQDKMVDLEMKRVVNESEGLVWPSQRGQRRVLTWRNENPFDESRQAQPRSNSGR